MNNTGSDAVRLFWPDKKITTSLAYTGPVKEDQSYAQKFLGVYEWTANVTKGNANQFVESIVSEGIIAPAQTKIKFSEIFPNPKGADSGGEWVELRNEGEEPVYLNNWYLDDGEVEDELGSSAYKIPSSIIYPGGLVVLMIPSEKFAVNNISDTIRLFNENEILIDSISYSEAKENESYSIIDGQWVWSLPTPNAANQFLVVKEPVRETPIKPEPEPVIETFEEPIIEEPVEEEPIPEVPLAEVFVGQVAGTNIIETKPAPLWPWLTGSFAVNLFFCYILIRLMNRKTNV